MSCPDLCTARECEELSRRISVLEQALELLEASFEAHTNQDIPEAHDYTPKVDVSLVVDSSSNSLKVFVKVDESSDDETVTLPRYEPDVDVALAVDSSSNSLKVFVAVGDKSDDETVTLPLPEIEEHIKSNLRLNGIFQDSVLILTVADGESQDTASISIPLPEIEEHIKSNLKLNGSFGDNVLYLTVADGESQDTASISITLPEIPEILDMNCDNLQQEVQDCCQQLTNLISNNFNNLDNQLINLENAINTEVKEVYDQVTVDISGTANSNYSCKFPQTDPPNSKPIPGYAESMKDEQEYMGKGLQGLHENLKLINTNLDALHSDICKAVDPISRITVDDLYKYCDKNANVDNSLYFNEDGSTKYITARDDYEAAVATAVLDLINSSKYAYLLEDRVGNILMSAPNNWITPILADFSLIQSRINNDELCNLGEIEQADVVSIVASDKFIPRASGKFLVLHFVTLDNYPKRARNSTYWQVQIPAALPSYDWKDDFEPLRFNRGNCYTELRFVEFKNPVSGFFESKNAANSYFNAVLNLTTATEKNRVYSEHKTPQTNVTKRETLPYRAFIESVNSEGQAICHVKYVPPIESEDDGN